MAYRQLNDDSLMREMNHMHAVLSRHARKHESLGAPLVLGMIAGHEQAIAEGFATGELTQVQLAHILGIRPQSLGPMLAQMEKDGLIEREASDRDKRALTLALTDEGRDQAQEVRARQKRVAESVLSCLTEEEKAQLSVIVQKLNESLDETLP